MTAICKVRAHLCLYPYSLATALHCSAYYSGSGNMDIRLSGSDPNCFMNSFGKTCLTTKGLNRAWLIVLAVTDFYSCLVIAPSYIVALFAELSVRLYALNRMCR